MCTGEGLVPAYLGVSGTSYSMGLHADLSSTESVLNYEYNDDNTISFFNSTNTKILTCDSNYLIWIDYDDNEPITNACKWYLDKSNYAIGDVNIDGIIDDDDCSYLQSIVAHSIFPTNVQRYLGDYNKDRVLDSVDVTLLQRLLSNSN